MTQNALTRQVMRAVACWVLWSATMPVVSYALEAENAAYFCTREISAGLAYNAALKKWEGVQIPAQPSFNEFTLKMKFLKERVQRNILDEKEDVLDYEVAITEAGTNDSFPCTSAGTGFHTRIVVVGEDETLICSGRTYNFTFNLENGRYVSVFLFGYLDGIDSNENTPMVSGGTCTKIDQTK